MNITLNNREENFSQSKMTISELLDVKKFTFKMIVVRINNMLIKKADYDKAEINDGDNVLVIHLMSGG
jgi:thiamine biosynthesis protein ThiS